MSNRKGWRGCRATNEQVRKQWEAQYEQGLPQWLKRRKYTKTKGTMSHTKTPWKQHNIYVDAADNSRTICMCGVGTTAGNETDNAAHIVRCVNSHESLVEALKDILAAYHGLTLGRQDTEWEGQLKVAARKALALADPK